MKDVIVYAEHRGGESKKVTFEMATEARRLADALGGKAHAVVVGGGSAQLAEQLKSYPLDVIHVSEDSDVDKFLIDPVVDYLESAAKAIGPSLILIPNTLSGRDVAGKLLARLGAGIGADVTDFKIENGKVECVSPKMGGALITTCEIKPAEYGIATIRPNAFAVAAGG
ncbi:MAG TPA: hypothetical protein VFE36_14140, partial [Candidatus Baltobacteraceae bacterium]|nr:hypothetical protein [Candidatus Baltobacteraceae bacterium]